MGPHLRWVGQVSAIVDNGSPILLGSRGRHRGHPFEVVGRLQVAYERGSWNEWFVHFADGNVGWLTDAQGQFSLLRAKDAKTTAGRVPPYHTIAINTVLVIDGVPGIVVDKRGASYQGAEGILPFAAEPGLQFFGVDLRGYNGEFMSLDYGYQPDHTQPLPYLGETIDLTSVGLQPLRRFSGWPHAPQGLKGPSTSRSSTT